MGGSSKELLMLEKESSASAFQSSLLVSGSGSSHSLSKVGEKLVTAPIPQSQVLGKVRDFLGVFSEANQQLQRDSKVNCTKYDIEALTGNESQLIEMDLMLGVAELRNQQALDAAEAALAGAQPLTLDGSESDSSDESGSENSNDDNEKNSKDASMLGEDGSSRVNKRRPKKQPKIVEMPGSSM
ncbi:hypothetical protein LINGRAHAP2_LOCUS25195 [Linum grandiflorum]